MNLWRIQLKPDAQKDVDPIEVCKREKIVGIGWRVEKVPEDKEDYIKMGKKKYGSTQWKRASKAIVYRMKEKDLVWFRDSSDGTYYLAKIKSDWNYCNDEIYRKADLINVRNVEYYEVEKTVPGKIKYSFGPPATVQRIRSKTMEKFSKLVFNEKSGEKEYEITKPINKLEDIFEFLDTEELEDLVGLYLQKEHNYILLPSSRSRTSNTIAYEYELISKEKGERAYVQVKSGNIMIDPKDYFDKKGKWYLFSPNGYKSESNSKDVITLENKSLLNFAKEQEELLPISIRAWLDYGK